MEVTYRYPPGTRRVLFLSRPNRFLAWVRPISGSGDELAHVPNPGRMKELLIPGVTEASLAPFLDRSHKTVGELVAVRHRRSWVSIDTSLGPRLVHQMLQGGRLGEFRWGSWSREVTWGNHRFDFGVWEPGFRRVRALLEVKSSNLRMGGSARFPDAPTRRGASHLRGLARAQKQGIRCGVIVTVQRGDVERFQPNHSMDPEFSRAIRIAAAGGVKVRAYTMKVGPDGAAWGRPLPVVLDEPGDGFL